MKCAKSVFIVLGFTLLSPAPFPHLTPFSHLIPALPAAHAQEQLWLRQFGTSTGGEWATALAPDDAGGVMVSGWTNGSLGGPNAGSWDVFLARHDQLWLRQFGTTENDEAFALAPDGVGGVMVAGVTRGNLGGPHAGGFIDAFLARYDGAGNQLWIRQFGTSEIDYAAALAPDGAGGVMIAGYTLGSLGGPNAGGRDAFLARYDSAGNQLWIRQFGTIEGDEAAALAPDGAGGVMVAGTTRGNLGGPLAGSFDAWIARYDASGSQIWITQFGMGEASEANALALDSAGGVMVAGLTVDSLKGGDVFLARYEIDSCYADCDQSTGNGVLDIFDFLCFQNSFVNGETYACDCDTTTGPLVCDIFDFLCFQNAFVGGCP